MNKLVLILVMSLPISWPQSASTDENISKIPDGRFEGKTYRDGSLEVTFRLHDGWNGSLPTAQTASFAPERSASDDVNRCSKVLFVSSWHKDGARLYGPRATQYVFDPACFPGVPFPASSKDREGVTAFANRLVHAFVSTPYIASDGADFGAFDAGSRTFVTLVAERQVPFTNAGGSISSKRIHSLLMCFESDGYWIITAELLDDDAKKIMQAGSFDVSSK